MANRVKNNWLVKNDGSAKFKETVVKYINLDFTVIGSIYEYYYGIIDNKISFVGNINSIDTNNVKILTISEFEEFIKVDEFNRDSLNTGMLVEDRRGYLGKVMLGTKNGDIIAGFGLKGGNKDTWKPIDSINLNLSSNLEKEYDIIKVYDINNNCNACSRDVDEHKLIWELKENKKFKLSYIKDNVDLNIELIETSKELAIEKAKSIFKNNIDFKVEEI